jgi:apolipoprotein N-acyltransferase
MFRLFLIAATLAALVSAYFWGAQMYALDEKAELWGHQPLFLFVSVLAVIYFGLASWQLNNAPRLKALGLSALSGLLMSVGFVPMPLILGMFVGLVPLLYLEANLKPQIGKFYSWLMVYLAFLSWNVLCTYWVANSAFSPALVAITVNALLQTTPYLLWQFSKKHLHETHAYLVVACAWIGFEYLHLNWDLSWSWLNLGNSLAHVPALIQWYQWTGVFGGSLWILVANYLIFKTLTQINNKSWSAKTFLKPSLWLVLPICVSMILKFSFRLDSPNTTYEILAVQPNYEPHHVKFNKSQITQLEEILTLIRQNITPQTQAILLPETTFSGIDYNQLALGQNTLLDSLYQLIKEHPQARIVLGIDAYKILGPEETPTQNAFKYNDVYIESHNAAIQLDANPRQLAQSYYKKSKLVPGPEIFPFKEFLFFLEPLIKQFGGFPGGLTTQPERTAFFDKNKTFGIAPVICYESIFGEFCGGYTQKNANLLAVITNDGWWDNTLGHRQHLHMASLRAIEQRRFVVRAANSGISACIDPYGNITQQTPYNQATVLKCRINPQQKITFYALYGDYLAKICLFALFAILLSTIARKLKKNT